MKSPRLPHYYHLPIALVLLFVVLSVAWTVWVGIGSWNLNRTINWGGSFGPWVQIFIKIGITLLPALAGAFYFLRRFFRRQEVHLGYSLLIVGVAVLLSLAIMPLLY
jgi:hypothetical protein